MYSTHFRTLRYVDRQRAFVIYDAIAYSKHCYENSNMVPTKNLEGHDFRSTRI